MLKQKKNSNTKKKHLNKSRLRNVFKNKLYEFNSNFQALKNLTRLSKIINIKINPNNIFCTLKSLNKKKILSVGSSGKYKIKTSKKTLRFSTKAVLNSFLNEIRNKLISKEIFITVISPIRIRKSIFKQLTKYFRKKVLILHIDGKKCFNGCRPKKKKRKKQKSFQMFK
jgi:ribosomal protein S11